MSSNNAAGLAGAPGLGRQRDPALASHGSWERSAPWLAPLLTAGVLAAATFLLFVSSGAALI
jgi:hypothetical protein